jgi:hypothetical protein
MTLRLNDHASPKTPAALSTPEPDVILDPNVAKE